LGIGIKETLLKDVDAMDEMLYDTLCRYYHSLELKGYMPSRDSYKLLVLAFLMDFVRNDYRGIITEEDYHLMERALDCLYGTTCLIPYPDYLKMGKLHLGEVSELAYRLRELEEADVLKLAMGNNQGSDVEITTSDV
jgi:hypothetical protein